MNREIRRFGTAIVVLYLVLFAQLNWIQLGKANEYAQHPANTRAIIRDFGEPRGTIQTADGLVVAQSVPTPDSGFERLREYPQGGRYAHVSGYFSFTFGSEGVEKTYNDELTGRSLEVSLRSVGDLFLDRRPTANVTLTLHSAVQNAAADALGERKGAVVAIDPRDGAVLAMYSWPTFDPNVLSAHNQSDVRDARKALLDDPAGPLKARTYRERYFPGSTFKIVTATAGLESGEVTPTSPVYPSTNALQIPTTNKPLRNFGGSTCGGDLFRIIQVSCNTAFGQMGLDVGADALSAAAEAYGFRSSPPIDLPAPAASAFPTPDAFERDLPALAQSAIGQRDVQATPLQMALVAAAVGNGGLVPVPRVMAEIRDDDGEVVRTGGADTWRRAMGTQTAELLRQAMIGVVTGGTATGMQIPGVGVGAKTGTAELTGESQASHAWIIAFAPADVPRVAVAVIVEGDDSTGTQTGGRVAGPIARAVIEAALAATQ